MREKNTFISIFLVFALTMIVLPFMVTFNDILTRFMERFVLYVWIQELVVPLQAKMVGVLVSPFVTSYTAYRNGMVVNGLPMRMTWNCLGWQSLLLFSVSLVAGLRGHYLLLSKIEATILGLVGIFWVNLIRITFTVLLGVFAPPLFRIVFHDYLAAFTTVAFLILFWWFAYAYVLIKKTSARPGEHPHDAVT